MRHERKNIRLRNFDYRSEFPHYVTICTRDRQWFFGEIMKCKMEYSQVGEIAELYWKAIPNHFPHVVLDEYIVMPNHIHGIIKLDYRGQIGPCHGMALLSNDRQIWNDGQISNDGQTPNDGQTSNTGQKPHPERSPNPGQIQFNKFGHPVSGSVSVIINHFKSAVKRWCNNNGYEFFLWQPRFYDHIINIRKIWSESGNI